MTKKGNYKQPKEPPKPPKVPLPPIPGPQGQHTHKSELERRELTLQCIELRKQGYSYVRIGKALAISDKTVARYINARLDQLAEMSIQKVTNMRELQGQQLDAIIRAVWDLAIMKKDLWAIDRLLSTLDQKAKLFGLNKPVKTILAGDAENPLTIQDKQARDQELLNYFEKLASAKPDNADNIVDINSKKIPETTI